METPPGAPEWLAVHSAAEREDLWAAAGADLRFHQIWPEYNHHGNHSGAYFGALFPRFADLQLVLVDRRSDEIIARGRTIPFRWDGTLDELPAGIDAVGRRALDDPAPPSALSALAAEVLPHRQGEGLSRVVILAMASAARSRGLSPLVAPVRPSWKERYPITPIDEYATWTGADGLPFDPWMRVHTRLGARILRCEPRSLEITRPVEDWERWTSMPFPADGSYVFPAGLAPLQVSAGAGEYFEPNVWMLHEL